MTKSVQNFWTFSGHFQFKSKNVQKSGQIQKFWTRWALCNTEIDETYERIVL